MCTGLELLAVAGTAASVAGAVMNKPSMPSMPDPKIEREKAEADATQRANAKVRMQRKAMRDNSLLTGAGSSMGAGAPASASGGRQTLGV